MCRSRERVGGQTSKTLRCTDAFSAPRQVGNDEWLDMILPYIAAQPSNGTPIAALTTAWLVLLVSAPVRPATLVRDSFYEGLGNCFHLPALIRFPREARRRPIPPCLPLQSPLRAVLIALPGVNFAPLDAAIVIASPVCGLRPCLSARSEIPNVPKPEIRTSSPCFSVSVTTLTSASRALPASALLNPACSATALISSVWFMVFLIRYANQHRQTATCLPVGRPVCERNVQPGCRCTFMAADGHSFPWITVGAMAARLEKVTPVRILKPCSPERLICAFRMLGGHRREG